MPNDMEGAERPGWTFEYHNAYVDLYDVFHPVLSDDQRRRYVGRFNARAGRFYVPFGLNLQTDTHGTVLQLSNERNFGFERDWYSGIWGALNRNLDYGVYYLLGSGYHPVFKRQRGLAAARVSLSNRYLSDYGWEGGISAMAGERLVSSRDRRATATGVSEQGRAEADLAPVETQRLGVDARYRRAVPRGLLTGTSEVSGGRDASDEVLSQLYQADYLHASRRWGLAGQYRRFRHGRLGTDVSLAGDAAWYFRNDVGSSNLHWVRINVERQLERMSGSRGVVVTLQYYVYL